jgi:hypothetical protein
LEEGEAMKSEFPEVKKVLKKAPQKIGKIFSNKAFAKRFGKYTIFTGPHIEGEVRGWIWLGTLYFDLDKE